MSAYAAAPNAYRRSSVLTASAGQLVAVLYGGAHRSALQTAGAMRGDVDEVVDVARVLRALRSSWAGIAGS